MAEDMLGSTGPARPQSAPFRRTVEFAQEEAGDELLKFEDIVRPEAMEVLSQWWCKTKPHIRAYARWIFEEPDGLPQPRQRVRRTAHHYVPEGELQARQRTDADRLAGIRFKSTYQEFFPEPEKSDAARAEEEKVWLMAFGMTHAAVLKKGATERISTWMAGGASARRQQALAAVLYSLHDFRTARQGATTSGRDFQPKPVSFAGRVQPISDPFRSAIGRPSSAPIAHAVHRKFEAEKRRQLANMIEQAHQQRQMQMKGLVHPRSKGGADAQRTSGNPFKWPVPNAAMTSATKEMMESITPTMRASARLQDKKHLVPRSSGGCGRLIGEPQWHGDAMHAELHAQARYAYPWARKPGSALPMAWARENRADSTAKPSLDVLGRSGYSQHPRQDFTIPLVVRTHSCGV
jgi:hypothetical protein